MTPPPNPARPLNQPAAGADALSAQAAAGAGGGWRVAENAGKGRSESSRGVTNGFWGASSSTAASRQNSWAMGQSTNQASTSSVDGIPPFGPIS